MFNFTSCASASTGAAKCVKHTALLEYNAVLCGHISCITAFGAQIPLTGITGDDPEVSSFFVKCSQTFNFAGMTFLHSASHVAAQLTSALQQLVCVTSLQICEWGTFVYSGGAAWEESINLNMGGP